MSRDFDRGPRDLRPVKIQRGFTPAAGSVLYDSGRTRVLCTALVEEGLPGWRAASLKGWVTATYLMLPASTPNRQKPSSTPDGRSVEIQRLIGRALRAAVDFGALGARTIHVDCQVLYADAGTRTACINAGYLALQDAIAGLIKKGLLEASPLRQSVEAVSVGLIEGEPRLDLCYLEDSRAEVDLNVVSANGSMLIEVQGTAEDKPIPRSTFNTLLDLAMDGLAELHRIHSGVPGSQP